MKWRHYVTAILFLLAILSTALIGREQWWLLSASYASAFGLYVLIILSPGIRSTMTFWLFTAIAARAMLIGIFPNLSDDIFRFIWDGHLVLSGINPYTSVPTALITSGTAIGGISEELYAQLNSPDYYSVYPPLDQLVFAIAAWIGGNNHLVSAIVMKLFIFLCELLTLRWLYLILRERKQSQQVLVYALNPLVIIELVGNTHFEALMITGLVATCYFLQRGHIYGVIAGMTTAIGVKLLPLIFIPFLVRRFTTKMFYKTFFWIILLSGVILLPMILSADKSGSSVGLYFRTFEFNASLYYVARWIGYMTDGYNQIRVIGPFMAGVTVLFLAILFFAEKHPRRENFARVMLFALTLYLLMSTTVHPWYVTTLVALASLSGWQYPVVWSGVVFLSYSAYRSTEYTENLWLVALEYAVVFAWMGYEAAIRRPHRFRS